MLTTAACSGRCISDVPTLLNHSSHVLSSIPWNWSTIEASLRAHLPRGLGSNSSEFLYYGRPVIDSVLDFSALPPAAALLPPMGLTALLHGERMQHKFRYYSAQLLEVVDGTVQRAVDSEVIKSLAADISCQ